jgi:hypothetical protein
MIKRFKIFTEELNIKNLDLRTKKEIIQNFKQRILELKSYWRDETLNQLSLYDKRNILRQFINEFSEEFIIEINFKEFIEESSNIFHNKKELNKLLNKYLDKISNL